MSCTHVVLSGRLLTRAAQHRAGRVSNSNTNRRVILKTSAASLLALFLCALFVCAGALWIGRPGIQTDEALFAGGIYPPFAKQYVVRIFQHDVPMMVMSYVGALKSWIWAAIFQFWPPSPESVRYPALLLSAVSVWWVYRLLLRAVGTRAALTGAALLATDPVYILNSRWDFGPVVLQHVCLTGAMLAFVRFHQESRRIWIFAGCLALGLGLWEKAVFIWLLTGLAAATLAIFPGPLRKALTLRNAAIAVSAFAIGALPLIIFNVRQQFVTFRGNAVYSADAFPMKVEILRNTFEGDVLFGSMTREPWDGPIRSPEGAGEQAMVAIAAAAGMPTRTYLPYIAFASVILLPLVWRTPARSAFFFVLICGGVAWLQMAFTKGAGGAAHHSILLWPLPAIGIAAVISEASKLVRPGRAILTVLMIFACSRNLLVLSTYYTNLLRNGGTSTWTDGMYPALRFIGSTPRTAVCTIDWGFIETLRMYERGRNICVTSDPVDAEGRRIALYQLAQPGYLFLTHTEGQETFPGVTARFVEFAGKNGFRRINHRVFSDSNGRKTVEVFQFARAAPNSG